MSTSASVIDRMKDLAAAGRHADIVAELRALENDEVQDSPFLALIYGAAQARLGQPGDGLKWVELAGGGPDRRGGGLFHPGHARGQPRW